MFSITMNKGFQMTFPNGITLSVQFGGNNYCDNRSLTAPYGDEMGQSRVSCANAEIAIGRGDVICDGALLAEALGEVWEVDEDGYGNRDTVEGWVDVPKLVEIITKISAMP